MRSCGPRARWLAMCEQGHTQPGDGQVRSLSPTGQELSMSRTNVVGGEQQKLLLLDGPLSGRYALPRGNVADGDTIVCGENVVTDPLYTVTLGPYSGWDEPVASYGSRVSFDSHVVYADVIG